MSAACRVQNVEKIIPSSAAAEDKEEYSPRGCFLHRETSRRVRYARACVYVRAMLVSLSLSEPRSFTSFIHSVASLIKKCGCAQRH